MQGLPDHAHEPTLKRISRDRLIIASPAGAKVAKGLGFTNVIALDHGEETTLGNGKLHIHATVGESPALAIPKLLEMPNLASRRNCFPIDRKMLAGDYHSGMRTQLYLGTGTQQIYSKVCCC
jgi:hypothetical protein